MLFDEKIHILHAKYCESVENSNANLLRYTLNLEIFCYYTLNNLFSLNKYNEYLITFYVDHICLGMNVLFRLDDVI